MATQRGTLRICEKGHRFYKSSECLTCPVCEKNDKPVDGFLSGLSSPARSALLHAQIDSIEKLSNYTRKEILKLHGMGKASLPILCKELEKVGLTFKQ